MFITISFINATYNFKYIIVFRLNKPLVQVTIVKWGFTVCN